MTNWLHALKLTGNGVSLEPLTLSHADELEAALAEGGIENLWHTLVPGPGEVQSYIADALAAQSCGAALPFLIRSSLSGAALGSTRFCNIDHANQRAEIGYTWLVKSARRTSVNSACKLLLLQHAFEERAAIAIEFRTHWHNRASRNAIARLGAKQDGVLRQHRRDANGAYRDTVVFSILNSEWPSSKLGLEASLEALSSESASTP
ncbi:MAG: RimJ/RimL family protein N-acetyltransferase [Planctomycetota bacterium]|jgi:RimJ/RimL family protein N-acetyltransferase